MKKKKIAIFGILILSFSIANGDVVWMHKWDCNELPENFLSGGVHVLKHNNNNSPTRIVTNGVYIVDTGANSGTNLVGGESTEALTSGWNSISNSTIQFRMKVDDAYSGYACRFILADDATDEKEYIIRFYEGMVEAQYSGEQASFDTTVMTTYRIVYYAGLKIELWYQIDDGNWKLLVTENGASYSGYVNDFFRLGSTSSSVDGKYEIDYLYWENGTAEPPEPVDDFWEFNWDCNQFPEIFDGGSALAWRTNGAPDRVVSNGVFIVDTRDGEGGHDIQTKPAAWSSDTNGTVELRFKIDDTYGGYGFRFIVSDTATDGTSREYILMWYDNHVESKYSGESANIDTTVMTTYRLLYYDNSKLELWKYYGPQLWDWRLLVSETGSIYNYHADFFRLGSTSPSVDGKYEIDRLYWQNHTAEIPPPPRGGFLVVR